MIEKPDIPDEIIASALQVNYSISVNSVKFLPVGNDASAWAYRVDTNHGDAYFLKIKKGISNLSGLFVPHFLKDSGIKQAVAPLSNKMQALSTHRDGFELTLY